MAVFVAVMLMLPLAAGFAAAGTTTGSGTFVDDDGNIHEADIETIAAAGITVGCDDVNHLYCPDGVVTRAQMVAFLIRALGESRVFAYQGYFGDVLMGYWYTPYVERAKQLGIADGYPDGMFRPDQPVTRAEAGVFLLRAYGEDTNLPSYKGTFADVPSGAWYAGYAERMYELGLTNGCSIDPLRYCGEQTLRRDEMASFLARALSVLTPPTTTTTSGGGGTPPPANGAPVANDDDASTLQDVGVTIDVVANDTDADGNLDPSSAANTSDPAHGTLSNNGDGTFDYTPDAGYVGDDTFDYQVCDTGLKCDTATVAIHVVVNNAPVANDDSASTLHDVATTVDAVGNDTDADGNLDPSSATNTSDPAHGTLSNNGDGTFDYTPDAGYVGDDTFDYQVCDTGLKCDTATVTVHIAAFVSDDFYASSIDTSLWTFTDPLSDSSFDVSDTDNQLVITVPAGTAHDLSTGGLSAPRLLQPAANGDFVFETKFESQLGQSFQDQGIVVQADADTLLRFDVYASNRNTIAYAGFVDPGGDVPKASTTVGLDHQPMWLKVTRSGDNWTYEVSSDGSDYSTVATFAQAMNVTAVGVYAGNTGSPAPGQRVVVDYVFDDAAPIVPEDGGATIFDIWYGDNQKFGNLGTAQKWIDILGNVDDPDGISSLMYSLNGGTERDLLLGPDFRRKLMPGDFDAQIWSGDGTTAADGDLIDGDNTLVLTATDGLSNVTTKTVHFTWQTGNTWSLPYSIDWSAVTDIQDVAQVVDGNWEIVGGQLHQVGIGYDRLVAIGEGIDPGAWDSYTVTVPITILGLDTVNGYDSPSAGPALGVLMGWDGHEDCTTFSYVGDCPWDNSYTPPANDQPSWGWWPMGSLGELRWTNTFEGMRITDNEANTMNSAAESIAIGDTYMFKMQVEVNATGPLYSLKIWDQDTESEPLDWEMTYQETSGAYAVPSAGSFLLLVHHVDVLIGNVTVAHYTPPA